MWNRIQHNTKKHIPVILAATLMATTAASLTGLSAKEDSTPIDISSY
jgi:hypothetical protein